MNYKKRRYYDEEQEQNEKINRHMFSEDELKRISPGEAYQSYFESYCLARVPRLFDELVSNAWFSYRYFNQQRIDNLKKEISTQLAKLLSGEQSSPNKINISINNIPSYITYEELLDFAKKAPGFKDLKMHQGTRNKGLYWKGFILLNEESDVIESIRFLNSLRFDKEIRLEAMILDQTRVNQSNIQLCSQDIENIKDILNRIIKYYERIGVSEELIIDIKEYIQTFSENKLFESYHTLLREVFYYCYFCTRQFDSYEEMIQCCGTDHITVGTGSRGNFNRKLSLITRQAEYAFLKIRTLENELDKHIIILEEGIHRCDICSKSFENSNFVRNHIQKKHKEIFEKARSYVNNYNLFIERMDFYFLFYVEGSCVDVIEYKEKINKISYDFIKVFSGDVKIL
ncbi:Zinc finger C2H2 protein [Astathelohania contejeani]|uniref:Zinc finger C2H2 protein n=1 Tax=Astathelohania contejeani TaxID=164912 RepID=A0ABQ7I2K9_9MICR|nr:Zinc finger C2H2 protein [Thelohania contejeani]